MARAVLRSNKLYKLPSGTLVRILRINHDKSKVLVYDYNACRNDIFELETAPEFFTPIFRIGEVAKMLGKKPDTLRKYEREGLIRQAERYNLGKGRKSVRLYTKTDIWDLVEFFMRRPGPGRPARTNVGGVNRKRIDNFINARYER